MAQSAGLHEPEGRLSTETIDRHRALTSIQEELEAVDWYAQRVDAPTNTELAAVLAHNRDEEKEHAVMTIEWLRRNDPVFDQHLRTYLFTTGSIIEIENIAEANEENAADEAGGGGGAARGGRPPWVRGTSETG